MCFNEINAPVNITLFFDYDQAHNASFANHVSCLHVIAESLVNTSQYYNCVHLWGDEIEQKWFWKALWINFFPLEHDCIYCMWVKWLEKESCFFPLFLFSPCRMEFQGETSWLSSHTGLTPISRHPPHTFASYTDSLRNLQKDRL